MADRPPPGADVSRGTRLGQATYQVVAVLAVLAHLLVVGPLVLLTLAMIIPPGADVVGLVLKAIVVVAWFGLGYVGVRAWNRASWWIVAVPIVTFVLVYQVIRFGSESIGWWLIGY